MNKRQVDSHKSGLQSGLKIGKNFGLISAVFAIVGSVFGASFLITSRASEVCANYQPLLANVSMTQKLAVTDGAGGSKLVYPTLDEMTNNRPGGTGGPSAPDPVGTPFSGSPSSTNAAEKCIAVTTTSATTTTTTATQNPAVAKPTAGACKTTDGVDGNFEVDGQCHAFCSGSSFTGSNTTDWDLKGCNATQNTNPKAGVQDLCVGSAEQLSKELPSCLTYTKTGAKDCEFIEQWFNWPNCRKETVPGGSIATYSCAGETITSTTPLTPQGVIDAQNSAACRGTAIANTPSTITPGTTAVAPTPAPVSPAPTTVAPRPTTTTTTPTPSTPVTPPSTTTTPPVTTATAKLKVPGFAWGQAKSQSVSYGVPLSAALTAPTTAECATIQYVISGTSRSIDMYTLLDPGNYIIDALCSPTDTAKYDLTTSQAAMTITKAKPIISWSKPGDIAQGTALSAGSGQLTAIASIPGNFAYGPVQGTVLGVGNNQILGVTFTPNDSVRYDIGGAVTTINVIAKASTSVPAKPSTSTTTSTPTVSKPAVATAANTVTAPVVATPVTPTTPAVAAPIKPIISNISLDQTKAGVTVTWTTDRPTKGYLSYGGDSNYGSTVAEEKLETAHKLTIPFGGVIPGSTYHYNITAVDDKNVPTNSEDQTFLAKGYSVQLGLLDANGKPLAGATVTFAGQTATTDENGYVSFSDVPGGSQDFTAVLGENSFKGKVDVAQTFDETQKSTIKTNIGKKSGSKLWLILFILFLILALIFFLLWWFLFRHKNDNNSGGYGGSYGYGGEQANYGAPQPGAQYDQTSNVPQQTYIDPYSVGANQGGTQDANQQLPQMENQQSHEFPWK
jgi:hypothetical protein